MIRIESLHLSLPHEFAPSAAEFARQVGDALARIAADHGLPQGHFESVRAEPVLLGPDTSLAQAATAVATRVVQALARQSS